MSDLPPLPTDPHKADDDHLRLLAIFHFVGAGLAVLGLGFLALHYGFMRFFFLNPDMWKNQKQPGMDPGQFFAFFQWFYLLFALWFVASGVLNLLSGLYLRRRTHRTFSMVVAGFNCVHMPLGTVLGVFTLIVLLRESVRTAYEPVP